jgi:hypothetical protein
MRCVCDARRTTGDRQLNPIIQAVLEMFESGEPPIPYSEMRTVIAFSVAAGGSRKAGGVPVALQIGTAEVDNSRTVNLPL